MSGRRATGRQRESGVTQMAGTKVAIGFRSHSGWAALSVLAGPLDFPAVIDRWRIELADLGIDGSKQPYHAAEKLDMRESEKVISCCGASTALLARDSINRAARELQRKGHRIVGCGVLLASGRPLPALQSILASHALIHTAEGEFFRNAILQACADIGLPTTGVKEKELLMRCQEELHIPEEELQDHLARMGRSIGPPWRQDEKFATLAAWLALADAVRAGNTERGTNDKSARAHVR
jgi:hypothetical protein